MRWDRKVGKHRLDLLNLHLSQKPAGGAGVGFLPETPPHRIPEDTSHRHSHPNCMNGVPCSLPRVPFYPVEACGGPMEAIGVEECLSVCGGEFQDFLHLCFSLCLTQKWVELMNDMMSASRKKPVLQSSHIQVGDFWSTSPVCFHPFPCELSKAWHWGISVLPSSSL